MLSQKCLQLFSERKVYMMSRWWWFEKQRQKNRMIRRPKSIRSCTVCICEWFYSTTQWQKALLSPTLKNTIQECLLHKKFSINKYFFENI